MQARVKDVVDGSATLEGHRKFKATREGLVEVPVDNPSFASVKVSCLEKPLLERFESLLRFVDGLSRPGSDRETERKAI
jgi:hypothetical protein